MLAQLSKEQLDRFANIFDIPGFIVPWLDRFFDISEIKLALLLSKKPLNATEILNSGMKEYTQTGVNDTNLFLERCFKRGIIDKCELGRFKPANFHARFEIWSMFEGWKDLPEEIRKKLNIWELKAYCVSHFDQINTLKNNSDRDPTLKWSEYILLHEAESIIDRVDHIYLWPCDCRSMMKACKKNIYTCLRFSNNRDVGWEISKSRAKEIIVDANNVGLMQNGEIAVASNGTISGAICNCCADCCYEHRLAEDQKVQKLWPLTRYIAKHQKDRCIVCGRCAKRCPFVAIKIRKQQYSRKSASHTTKNSKPIISFYGKLCRGCGLCSTGCPEKAIEMVRLDNVSSAWENLLF